MYIILASIIILAGMITAIFGDVDTEGYGNDWRAELQAENEQLQAEMEESEFAIHENSINKNNYYLEQDIKPQPYDAWAFTSEFSMLGFMLSLFMVIIASGLIAGEFRWGTIKLLFIRPISRTKIWLSKYITIMITTLSMFVFMFLFAMILGSLLFGINGLSPSMVQLSGNEWEQVNIVKEILSQYGLILVELVIMATLAFMISSLFRNSAMAIGLTIFLMFAGASVVIYLSEYDWAKFILFANIDLQPYFGPGQPMIEGMTLTFSVIVLLTYYVVFLLASWFAFTKRDVAGH